MFGPAWRGAASTLPSGSIRIHISNPLLSFLINLKKINITHLVMYSGTMFEMQDGVPAGCGGRAADADLGADSRRAGYWKGNTGNKPFIILSTH